jgi:hypothetical protein
MVKTTIERDAERFQAAANETKKPQVRAALELMAECLRRMAKTAGAGRGWQ